MVAEYLRWRVAQKYGRGFASWVTVSQKSKSIGRPHSLDDIDDVNCSPCSRTKKVRGESIGMLIVGLNVHRCDVDSNPMLHPNALARAEGKKDPLQYRRYQNQG